MIPILIIVGIIATALLGGSTPFFSNSGSNQNQPGGQAVDPDDLTYSSSACKPQINTSKIIQVEVRNGLEQYYVNNPKPEFNKEEHEWVLIKENAPIASWKAQIRPLGNRGGKTFSEMEHLGIAKALGMSQEDTGKEVYIGTGWCSPETGESFGWGDENVEGNSCLDPLVQDLLFVVNRKGEDRPYTSLSAEEQWINDIEWPFQKNPEPPHTQENLERYWWSFDVYYKASKLPANPTNDDLPCWVRKLADECPNGGDINGGKRVDARNIPGCEADVLGATDPDRPRLIIKKSEITLTKPLPAGLILADHYISVAKVNVPDDDIIGHAYAYHFDVRLREGGVAGSSADHTLILDPRLLSLSSTTVHDGPYWAFAPILATSRPDGASSLQLGSFVPGIPSFFYEWWTPSCKPALYLYPEKEMTIQVQVKPEGYITESIPLHGENGWDVTALPNGIITNNVAAETTYPYLYYEAAIKALDVPKKTGWIRARSELPAFFALTLEQLGLNEQERKDFLEYWIPKLQEGEKWFITLVDREELDRVEPIEFSKQPDNFIRVRFYFEKLDQRNMSDLSSALRYEIPNTIPKRDGFTVVDWGGILGNGTCGIEEKSQ